MEKTKFMTIENNALLEQPECLSNQLNDPGIKAGNMVRITAQLIAAAK